MATKKKQSRKTKKKQTKKAKVHRIYSSGQKRHLHAFRCDDELSDLLEGVTNKSEFITKAVMEQFSREYAVTCPTCEGAGQVFNPPVLKNGRRKRRMVKM